MKRQIFLDHFLDQSSRKCFLLIAMLLMSANSVVLAQTTTFTYQGRLTDGGTPATGNYVKYDRINVVLVNAIKEQQQQINAQQKQIKELQAELKRRRHSTNSSINSKLKSKV